MMLREHGVACCAAHQVVKGDQGVRGDGGAVHGGDDGGHHAAESKGSKVVFWRGLSSGVLEGIKQWCFGGD